MGRGSEPNTGEEGRQQQQPTTAGAFQRP